MLETILYTAAIITMITTATCIAFTTWKLWLDIQIQRDHHRMQEQAQHLLGHVLDEIHRRERSDT